MKLKITEQQLKFIIENEISDDNNIMEINMGDYEEFDDIEVRIIKIIRDCKKNNCNKIKIIGDLDLSKIKINPDLLQKFCDMLVEVTGNLNLNNTSIKSLSKLQTVKGELNLEDSQIESLPMLSSYSRVYLNNTPFGENRKTVVNSRKRINK